MMYCVPDLETLVSKSIHAEQETYSTAHTAVYGQRSIMCSETQQIETLLVTVEALHRDCHQQTAKKTERYCDRQPHAPNSCVAPTSCPALLKHVLRASPLQGSHTHVYAAGCMYWTPQSAVTPCYDNPHPQTGRYLHGTEPCTRMLRASSIYGDITVGLLALDCAVSTWYKAFAVLCTLQTGTICAIWH